MNLKRILISSLLIASVTSMTGCDMTWSEFVGKRGSSASAAAKQTVYAPELDPDVHELITDPRFKSLESDEPVRFETAVTPEEAASGTAVELRDSAGKKVSKMYDDGTHSDRIAGDGIYTCSYQPKAKNEESFSYTANIGGADTAPASVRYFDKITDQDVEDMKAVGKNVLDIQSKYTDSEGNVPEDKKAEALDAIGAYAKELCESGEAVEYRVNQSYDNVVVKLSSGITCVYSNSNNDNSKNGSISKLPSPVAPQPTTAANGTTIQAVDLDIKIYQPFLQQFTNPIDSEAAGYVASEFPGHCNVETPITDSDVSPTHVENFGPNQMIIWDGHGGYDPIIHSYICTSREFNELEYYQDDITEDRLLIEFHRERNDFRNLVCISSEYIDVHCPDMTDSFVYLGICYGTTDSVLSASFINKNCNAVVGYTDSVQYGYEQNILQCFVDNMCEKRTSNVTGYPVDYYSVDEALKYAKGIYGNDDADNDPAEPIVLGNRNYRFAEAIAGTNSSPTNLNFVRGNLKTERDYYRINVGDSLEVNLLSIPLDAGTLKWSIDDSSIATIYDFDPNDTLQTGAVQTMPTGTITGVKAGTTQGHVYTEDGLFRYSFTVIVTD